MLGEIDGGRREPLLSINRYRLVVAFGYGPGLVVDSGNRGEQFRHVVGREQIKVRGSELRLQFCWAGVGHDARLVDCDFSLVRHSIAVYVRVFTSDADRPTTESS